MKQVLLMSLLFIILLLTGCKGKNIEKIDPIIRYKCPNGYILDNDKCVYKTTMLASLRYTCPLGYYYNGSKCAINGSYWNFSKCNSFSTYYNGNCYYVKQPIIEYYCLSGTLDGTTCVTETYAHPSIIYECPNGYILNNNKCQK